MSADPVAVLTALVLANLAGGVGVLIVVALRRPMQRWVGPARAMWLWLIPLAAAGTTFLPARTVTYSALPAPLEPRAEVPVMEAFDAVTPALAPVLPEGAASSLPDLSALLLAAWLLGAAAFLAATLLRQRASLRRFGRLTREGDMLRADADDAGPAVVGVIRPRVVTPANFETRFGARERDMVLAHERAHIAAQHTRLNAMLALLSAMNWFNPLVHWASRLVRADQELACDAAVAERFPGERRIYAEALLKTQLASASLSLGCTWPPRTPSLLKERVMMLASKPPTRARRLAGTGLICIAAAAGGVAAWAAKPPQVEFQQMPSAPASPLSELMPMIAESDLARGIPQNERTPTFLNMMAATAAIGALHAPADARVIPDGQIVDTTVWIRLPDGEELGPYHILNSLADGFTTAESANDDRFFGALMADVEPDGSLLLSYGLSIDGQPVLVRGMRVAQDDPAALALDGGYGLDVVATLRAKGSMSREQIEETLEQALHARDKTAPEVQQALDDAVRARMPETPRAVEEPLAAQSMASLSGATITCNAWNGRHSRDHLVVWDEVKGDLGVTLTFTDHYDPKVTFPNDAFPAGVYPASVAYPRPGMNLRSTDRYVYQSVSESVVDTITIDGLSGDDLRAVWQRFRMDQEGAHSIVLQGGCTRA